MDDETNIDAPLQSEQEEVTSDENSEETTDVTETEETKDPSDNLTPEHPRFKKVIADNYEKQKQIDALKDEMAELKSSINQRQVQEDDDSLTPEEKRALEKIEKNLLKEKNYLTRDELNEEKRVEKRASELTRLSDKYDGKNGFPRFETEDVVLYARQNGLGDNLEAAYREMHFDAIVRVTAKNSNNPTPPTIEKPTGGGDKAAPETQLTPEQIGNMSDDEYLQKRDAIMGSMKTAVKS